MNGVINTLKRDIKNWELMLERFEPTEWEKGKLHGKIMATRDAIALIESRMKLGKIHFDETMEM